ncbi:MAG: hypothetical protein ACJAUP_001319 [Cellvibrionaceae bacterium]
MRAAKSNQLEPYAYLKRLFTLLPQAKSVDDIDAMERKGCGWLAAYQVLNNGRKYRGIFARS